jgi:hypothetical protein
LALEPENLVFLNELHFRVVFCFNGVGADWEKPGLFFRHGEVACFFGRSYIGLVLIATWEEQKELVQRKRED